MSFRDHAAPPTVNTGAQIGVIRATLPQHISSHSNDWLSTQDTDVVCFGDAGLIEVLFQTGDGHFACSSFDAT